MSDYSEQTCHGTWMAETCTAGLATVIVPAYNAADLIAETLDSVYRQTYRPLEVLVIDDGSTDDTLEVVDDWAARHDDASGFRLRSLSQSNQGGPVARNHGLIESSGEFIQFLDCDDVLAPFKIERQVECLADCAGGTASYGPWRFFVMTDQGLGLYKPSTQTQEDRALKSWVEGTWSEPVHGLLWRRSDLVELGPWDEQLKADQDGEYAMRFLVRGGRLVFAPNAWAYYRKPMNSHATVSSNNGRIAFQSRFRVIRGIEKELTARGLLDEYRSCLSRRYAYLAHRCALHDRRLTNLYLKHARRVSPDGKLPPLFSYYWLSRIIGLSTKHKLGRLVRGMLRIPVRNKQSRPEVPAVHVADIQELLLVDER